MITSAKCRTVFLLENRNVVLFKMCGIGSFEVIKYLNKLCVAYARMVKLVYLSEFSSDRLYMSIR